jgi:hypothetical protein
MLSGNELQISLLRVSTSTFAMAKDLALLLSLWYTGTIESVIDHRAHHPE